MIGSIGTSPAAKPGTRFREMGPVQRVQGEAAFIHQQLGADNISLARKKPGQKTIGCLRMKTKMHGANVCDSIFVFGTIAAGVFALTSRSLYSTNFNFFYLHASQDILMRSVRSLDKNRHFARELAKVDRAWRKSGAANNEHILVL